MADCWVREKGRGYLFHHQPSPSSHLFSFNFSQVAAESNYGPADTALRKARPGGRRELSRIVQKIVA